MKCPKCQKDCNFREEQGLWWCTNTFVIPKTKKRRHCNYCFSQFKGSFLDNVHLPPWKIIVSAHHWLNNYWDHDAIIKGLHLSSRASVDWSSFCSEETDHCIENQDAIDGPGIIVEIDETLIARRKYERGRVLA